MAGASIVGVGEVMVLTLLRDSLVVDRTFLFHGLFFYGGAGLFASLAAAIACRVLRIGAIGRAEIPLFHLYLGVSLSGTFIAIGYLLKHSSLLKPASSDPFFLKASILGGTGLLFVCLFSLLFFGSKKALKSIGSRRMADSRRRTGVLGYIAFVILVAIASYFPPSPRVRPAVSREGGVFSNVLFIIINSVRADHLSLYGYPRMTAPNITAFATEGVVFSNAIAQGTWTKPAIASLLTSLPISKHGVTGLGDVLRGGVKLIPERLQEKGYRTACISANEWISPPFGFGRGIEYMSVSSKGKLIQLALGRIITTLCLRSPALFPLCKACGSADRFLEGDASRPAARTAEDLTEEAIRWAEEHREEPFFLYLHYNDPHFPYEPPPPYGRTFLKQQKSIRAMPPICDGLEPLDRCTELSKEEREELVGLYDGSIQYVDHWIGRLLNALKAMDLYEKTLIVLTADHGQEFYEHGGWGHGNSLFEETIRVPLVVKFPGGSYKGRYVEAPVGHVDIGPAVLEVLGLEARESGEGSVLVKLASGDDSTGFENYVISEIDPLDGRYGVALRGERYKLIVLWSRSEKFTYLYDLVEDPREERDVGREHQEIVRHLEQIVARSWGRAPPDLR